MKALRWVLAILAGLCAAAASLLFLLYAGNWSLSMMGGDIISGVYVLAIGGSIAIGCGIAKLIAPLPRSNA